MSDNGNISPLLDNHPREQLCFIIEKFGRSVINDSRRCRGLLKDLAPNHPRETNLLMLALEQKAVAELAEFNNSIPLSVQLERLAQRLHDNFGTQKEFAFWAVESWALALEDKSNDDAWLDELIAWADENDISGYYFNDDEDGWFGFPRDKQVMLALTDLKLWGDQFTELPEFISNLTNLNSLSLNECKLTELPDSICKLTNLTKLVLNKNQLTELPESIGNMTNLTELYLSGNELEWLPDSIGNLTNLTKLGLSDNYFSEDTIDDFIYKLNNLTKLDLRGNKLTHFPDAICSLTELTWLDISNNQLGQGYYDTYDEYYEITSPPDSIGNLTNLTDLNLSNNELYWLPESLGNLTNLTNLDLSNNQINYHINMLAKLTNLKCLDLRKNPIFLPPELSHLSHITRLDYPPVNIEESLNNMMEGKRTKIYENGDKYTGYWKNGKREGQGTYTYANGNKFIGEYKNDKRDGNGTFIFANGTVNLQIWKDGNCL